MRKLFWPGETSDATQNSEVQILTRNRLRIAGNDAALGLLWQPVQDRMPLREQARLAGGPSGGFDLYVPFGGGRQYGFASTKDGLAAKILAAASLVGQADWGDNWLAAFALPNSSNRWWVVAMRDQLVYEDHVHDSESAAEAAFRKSLEAPDWEKVVAPHRWNIEDAEEIPLRGTISNQTGVTLRTVRFWPKLVLATLVGALAVIGLFIGWSSVADYREQLALAQRQKQQDVVPVERAPWENAPDILDFTRQCERTLNRLAFSVAGWRLQFAECRASNIAEVTVRWQRQQGTASWIKAAVEDLAGKQVSLFNTGQVAEVTVPLSLSLNANTSTGPQNPPLVLDSILRDRFLTLGLEVKLVTQYGQTRSGTDGRAIIDYGYHTISTATSGSPLEHARLLSDISGVVPESLVFQAGSANWVMTARAYHPISVH